LLPFQQLAAPHVEPLVLGVHTEHLKHLELELSQGVAAGDGDRLAVLASAAAAALSCHTGSRMAAVAA
jgi:hypothetical protein